MQRDVTMPQLGMAQDAGKIVAWLKSAGDPVAKGDALFEVETDKATMEVEAQADGFLTGITATEGEDVPVGAVIARISDTAEDDQSAAEPAPQAEDDLPDGQSVTMPQLGMAQDSGVLVSWQSALGEAVAADDILFEVETDKSTMEVPAGIDGYLAATLAEAGDEVAVGAQLAIISPDKPAKTLAKAVSPSTARPPVENEQPTGPEPRSTPDAAPHTPPPRGASDRILASPKARRLALDRGLDLNLLVAAGHPQPFHVRDLETLADLSAGAPNTGTQTQTAATLQLTAEIETEGFADFAQWAASAHGLTDQDALLAGMAGASLSASAIVAIERFGRSRHFAVPADRSLAAIDRTDDSPDLIVRDLRDTALRSVLIGPEAAPVLTVMSDRSGLKITLECGADRITAPMAIALLSEFAGRMEQPLRHLL